MADCIFCKIIAKQVPKRILWENDHFLAFLDLTPVQPGHLLIIPKEHIETVFDMPDGLYEELFNAAKALSTPLQKAMKSVRVGMVIEGFGVPHTHLHLVPINKSHDLDSGNARPASPEELDAIADKIEKQIADRKIK